jgi:hypothetical protein
LKLAVVAHCPAVGVKVYEPEFWLSTTDGDHVPVIPLTDVVGSAGTLLPAQIVSKVPKLNVGVMFGFTVTVKFVPFAHCAPDGVKLYVPEFVLLTVEGFQVPVIPFCDVVGNIGTL